MIGERTHDGWQLRLQSRGGGRWFGAGFLAFWLCGWAVGEAFALWLLVKGAIALLTGAPPDPGREPLEVGPAVMVGLFLLVWLTLWTLGGIMAASELLRLLFGEDRITVASGRLTVRWLRGPVRGGRAFERHEIRRVLLTGRDDRLALETERGRVELSGLGTRPERAAAAQAIRNELGLAEASEGAGLPREWEVIVTPEGQRALVADRATRVKQARFASVATLFLAAIAFVLGREAVRRWDLWNPTAIVLALAIAAAAGTLWLARGRWEWQLGSGRMVLRRRYGAGLREVFTAGRLVLDRSSDSDGDAWYELHALPAAGAPEEPAKTAWRSSRPRQARSVVRRMNDAASVRELAAWLTRETGLPLEDRTTPQAREVQLAELRALLANAGPLGRWAGKLVDRADANQKRAG